MPRGGPKTGTSSLTIHPRSYEATKAVAKKAQKKILFLFYLL